MCLLTFLILLKIKFQYAQNWYASVENRHHHWNHKFLSIAGTMFSTRFKLFSVDDSSYMGP